MKTKLITIHSCETAKEVLLFTQFNESGDVEVVIQCWHSDYEQYEAIKFPDLLMAGRFICDFSELSANEYANSCTF